MSNQPQNKPVATEQELNDILRVRREKLAKLTEEGNNPYLVTKLALPITRRLTIRPAMETL